MIFSNRSRYFFESQHGIDLNLTPINGLVVYRPIPQRNIWDSRVRTPRYFFEQGCETLVTLAASYNRADIVYELISQGAFADARNSRSLTALMIACQGAYQLVVKVLLRLEAYPHHYQKACLECTDINKKTPLFYAVKAGSLVIVQWLLQAGANIDYQDPAGKTAFMWALSLKLESLGAVFLEPGFLIDNSQHSQSYHAKLQRMLSLKDQQGATALHYASFFGIISLFEKIVTLKPCLLLNKDKLGNPVLAWAAKAGELAMVQYLVTNYRHLKNNTNHNNETPLYIALENKHHNLIALLADDPEQEGDLLQNQLNYSGLSVLMLASKMGDGTAIKALLAVNTDCNIYNPRITEVHTGSWTALFYAVMHHQEAAVILLANDPNLDFHFETRTAAQWTVFELAALASGDRNLHQACQDPTLAILIQALQHRGLIEAQDQAVENFLERLKNRLQNRPQSHLQAIWDYAAQAQPWYRRIYMALKNICNELLAWFLQKSYFQQSLSLELFQSPREQALPSLFETKPRMKPQLVVNLALLVEEQQVSLSPAWNSNRCKPTHRQAPGGEVQSPDQGLKNLQNFLNLSLITRP